MAALYRALTYGTPSNPKGHLTFYQCDEGPDAEEVAAPIMVIPDNLDGEIFEAFGIAMPMRVNPKSAPPLWWDSYRKPDGVTPKRKTGGLKDADVASLKADLKAVEPVYRVGGALTPQEALCTLPPPENGQEMGCKVEYDDGEVLDVYSGASCFKMEGKNG